MDYFLNYTNSINIGLKNSIFIFQSNIIESNDFFNHINVVMASLKKKKGKIFFFGNGASAAFANHMALDFSKNGKILALSLSDSAMLTALSNDYSYDQAMVEFMKIMQVNDNDLVITISSSGNSSNIVKVLEFCRTKGIQTIGLSGLNKINKSLELSEFVIHVPMMTYGIVECIHQIFLHLILDMSMNIQEWNRDKSQNMHSSNFKL